MITMDKITLKELTPYLPYRLTFQHQSIHDSSDKISTMRGLINNYVFFEESPYDSLDIHSIYPLLRPLSDLTKEITHNGKKFVPAERLFDEDEWYKEFGLPNSRERAIEFAERKDRLDLCFPYNWWQLLFEWHFDVFGLIGRGLALPMEEQA